MLKILGIVLGAIVLVAHGAGALGVLFVIGVYAIIYCVILIGFALRLRKHAA